MDRKIRMESLEYLYKIKKNIEDYGIIALGKDGALNLTDVCINYLTELMNIESLIDTPISEYKS